MLIHRISGYLLLTMGERNLTTPTSECSLFDDMVLSSRSSGCLFGHPNPQKEPLRTPIFSRGLSTLVLSMESQAENFDSFHGG